MIKDSWDYIGIGIVVVCLVALWVTRQREPKASFSLVPSVLES